MRVTKANVRRVCAVCDRSLLQGEVAQRFSPDGLEFVDVCPLCLDAALDYGWVREGGPISPALSPRARKKRTRWSQLLGVSNGDAQPVMPEPVLRRPPDSDAALVEAIGGTVVVVLGDLQNIKITHAADLAYAEQLLGER